MQKAVNSHHVTNTILQILTLRMRVLVLLGKQSMFVSQIFEILTSISRINEPIPGMLGLF